MADIRIKDLATLESASLTGDVFVIDGTTGTRKLSAFSPTFGGNATVTGTLTVNGTSGSVIAGNADTSLQVGAAAPYQRAAIGLSRRLNYGDALFARNLQGKTASDNYTTVGTDSGSGYVGFEAQYGGVARILLGTGATTAGADVTPTVALSASTSAVSIPLTTASTTTSSGALVVGNGTSGGLGVGGAASIGGPILVGTSSDVYLSRVGAGILDIRSASSPGTAARLDVTGTTSAGLGLRQTGTRDWFISAESSELRVSCLTAASIFAFNSGTPVAMRDSTASTTTSSGALVVSGGVGVAGNLSIGGNVLIDKSAIEVLLKRSADTNDGLIKFQTGIFGDFGIGHRGTSDSDLHIYNYGTAADALKIAKNDSLATFAAAIRTAAPSGGTAANWKLGTVATVSPTSPNRTIEVDIGGTIYYIHAKTTNN